MFCEAEGCERLEEVFMRALGAVVGADVRFLEVAVDPLEVGGDEEAAVDEDGSVFLGLGVAGDFFVLDGQIAGLVEFQVEALVFEGFYDGGEGCSVSAHDVEAFKWRRYCGDDGIDQAA